MWNIALEHYDYPYPFHFPTRLSTSFHIITLNCYVIHKWMVMKRSRPTLRSRCRCHRHNLGYTFSVRSNSSILGEDLMDTNILQTRYQTIRCHIKQKIVVYAINTIGKPYITSQTY